VFELNGKIGFTTVRTTLYTFSTSPMINGGPQPQLGSITLAATGNKVVAVQDLTTGIIYAYVAEASSSKQLEIFKVNSDGSIVSPAVASAQISNAQQGQDIFVNGSGTRAYLVTNQ